MKINSTVRKILRQILTMKIFVKGQVKFFFVYCTKHRAHDESHVRILRILNNEIQNTISLYWNVNNICI